MVGRTSGDVNFDYEGPPVSVSNGMALDLVSQFGIQNAWYAFLKLRGLAPFKNDAEKELAARRFRNRVRALRRQADNLGGRADDLNTMLGKEFLSSDLVSSGNSADASISSNTKPPEKVEAKSSSNADESVNEKDESETDDLGKLIIDEDAQSFSTSSAKFQTPISETINSVLSQLKTSIIPSASCQGNVKKKLASSSTTNPNSTHSTISSTSPPQTLIKTVPAESKKTSCANSSTITAETLAKHRETIDDVVSSVMAKIRNNEPFESEALFRTTTTNSLHTTTSITTTTSGAKARKGKNVFVKSEAQLNDHSSKSTANTIAINSLGQLMSLPTVTSATLVDSSTGAIVTFPTSSNTSEHLVAPQSNVNASLMPDQVTILSNFTEIIRSSTSSHQTNPHLTPVTKIITQDNRGSTIPHQMAQQHFQQQQITQLPAGSTIQFPGFNLPLSAATASGIPVGISPQGTITLPNNITVQSLLQSLQQQSKKQQLVQLAQFQLAQPNQANQPIQLQIQPGIQHNAVQQNIHSQQQQILPDSSSQEINSGNVTSVAPIASSLQTSTLSPPDNTKTTKKRQYVRRKGVATTSEPADEVKSKTTKISNETPWKNTSIEEGIDTSASILKLSGKKVTPSKNDIVENIKNSTSKERRKEERKIDLEESIELPQKRTYIKKGAKKADVEAKPPLTKTTTVPATNKELESKKQITKAESKTSKTSTSQSDETIALKVIDLEKELQRCQRQLNTERNKTTSQKKRIDKLQSDLEKSVDAIQLVQIDLACQKTDNNNLMAENIALKAELMKVKTKATKAATTLSNNHPVTGSSKQVGRKPKDFTASSKNFKGPRAGAKRQNNSTNLKEKNEDREEENIDHFTFDEPTEYGRRQSKRICVARKNFLYQTY